MITFLRNSWYAAALSAEVSSASAMASTLLGHRIALFRDATGRAVAISDRCPHRFAMLHEGSLQDGIIECPYHGLRFDGAGACVGNPHGYGSIPDRARVAAYPIVERYGLLWIWLGFSDLADESLIPDLSALDTAEADAVIDGYMHTKAHYELITDNLMDLSHADYIHRTSLNTSGALTKLRPDVKIEGNTVRARWTYETDMVQPFFRSALPDPDGRCAQSFDMRWSAPSNLLLRVSARNLSQKPEDDAVYTTAHLLTPETECTTHYFYRGIRNWDLKNSDLNSALAAGIREAFESEDKPVLHSVQESMGNADLWSLEPVILPCDLGPVHARRMLQRLIKAERQQ